MMIVHIRNSVGPGGGALLHSRLPLDESFCSASLSSRAAIVQCLKVLIKKLCVGASMRLVTFMYELQHSVHSLFVQRGSLFVNKIGVI